MDFDFVIAYANYLCSICVYMYLEKRVIFKLRKIVEASWTPLIVNKWISFWSAPSISLVVKATKLFAVTKMIFWQDKTIQEQSSPCTAAGGNRVFGTTEDWKTLKIINMKTKDFKIA